MLKMVFRRPKECSRGELHDFNKKIIKLRGISLLELVKKAEFLVFVHRANELVGIGAIKGLNEKYRNEIFQKADLGKKAAGYDLELGWMLVDEGIRRLGVGGKIVECLLSEVKEKKVYAVAREGNLAMVKLLEGHGFRGEGESYLSKNGNYKLQIFLRK